MANINTKRKRKEGVAGYGLKRKTAVDTTRNNKTPWLVNVAMRNAKKAPVVQK